jgi:hypothetical protein
MLITEKQHPLSDHRVLPLPEFIVFRFPRPSRSFLLQDLVTNGLPAFLLTYIANSLFVLYLPVHQVMP